MKHLLLALALLTAAIAPARAEWFPQFTGDVTNACPGCAALTIAAGAVTASKLGAGAAAGNLGFTPAHSGANADITSLSGLTTPLSAAQGGTGGAGGVGGTPFSAPGATSAVTAAARAGFMLTPYDFASANSGGVAYADAQRASCTVAATATQNVAAISGTGCSFSAADVGKYIVIYDAGAALTTAPIASAAVGTAGSYTTLSSISVSDTGAGNGAVLAANAGLLTATLVGGGTGCPVSQAITLNVAGGTAGTVAQISGTTNPSGVLTGSLTVATAGVYSGLPSTSAASMAANGGTTCTTYPTFSSTWKMVTPTVTATGHNYTSPSLTYSSGAATATASLATPAVAPYSATITAVSGSNVTVSGAGFGATISGSHFVAWGHDDQPAIQALVNATGMNAAGQQSCGFIPPAGGGKFWGAASPIVANNSSTNLPSCLRGAGTALSQVLALAPMTQLLSARSNSDYSSSLSPGGTIAELSFDGNKIATYAGYLYCAEQMYLEKLQFNNAAPYGTNFQLGNSCGNGTWVNDLMTLNFAALYNGPADRPLFSVVVGQPDSVWDALSPLDASEANVRVLSGSTDTHLIHVHANNYPGPPPTESFWLSQGAYLDHPIIDGAQTYGVLLDSSGGYLSVVGGGILGGSSTVPTYGIYVTSTNAVNVAVDQTFDSSNVAINRRLTFANSYAAGSGSSGTLCPTGGYGNVCAGPLVAWYWSSASNYNVAIGAAALQGVSGTPLTAGGNVAVGNLAGGVLSGNSYSNSYIGSSACNNHTSGHGAICIGAGTNAPSATLSNFANIGNVAYYNLAATSVPTVSCGTSPSVDANANGKSGTVTCGSGTVTSGTITHSTAYQSWAHCRVTPHSALAGWSYSVSLGAITINATSLTGAVIDYDCDGV